MTKAEFVARFVGDNLGDTNTMKVRLQELAEKIFEGSTNNVLVVSDNLTLSDIHNGLVLIVDTDAKVITLPAASTGFKVKVINGGANGGVLVSIDPDGTEKIFGTTNASTNVALGQGEGKKILNTKATAIKGDSVELIGVAGTGWFATNFSGIWASEA